MCKIGDFNEIGPTYISIQKKPEKIGPRSNIDQNFNLLLRDL
jgi:hypothetical protein